MADEQKIAAVEGEKPMTDQELEAMLPELVKEVFS